MGGTLEIDRPLDGVLRLSISNPSKRNALDQAILDAIAEALQSLDGVRCVVLTGSAGMFSSGYDIGAIPADMFAVEAEKLVAHPFSSALAALDEAEVPTLAALCGPTIGGGLELALGCDLRIASARIQLGMPPAKLGLIYSHTGMRRFLDAIGEPRTRELFLLGRYIDAPTALSWGLVNWVVPNDELEAAALTLAGELAANAPLAISGNKSVLRELLGSRAALHPEIEQELLELRESSFASHDLREGVLAFAEKRRPSWKGR
jgi:enoyl-CoA hydratase/carnithine racemase